MPTRAVSPDDLGAWLLKCNADRSDIADRVARGERVDQWCVQPNYRTALMRPGQRVIFWVSGSRRGQHPGIWGLGWLAGGPTASPATPDAVGSRLQVPIRIDLLPSDARVGRGALSVDHRLRDLEVLRMPQGSNPSFVSLAHLRVIEEYVTWPSPTVP